MYNKHCSTEQKKVWFSPGCQIKSCLMLSKIFTFLFLLIQNRRCFWLGCSQRLHLPFLQRNEKWFFWLVSAHRELKLSLWLEANTFWSALCEGRMSQRACHVVRPSPVSNTGRRWDPQPGCTGQCCGGGGEGPGTTPMRATMTTTTLIHSVKKSEVLERKRRPRDLDLPQKGVIQIQRSEALCTCSWWWQSVAPCGNCRKWSCLFRQRHALSTSFGIFVVTYRVTNFSPKLVDMLDSIIFLVLLVHTENVAICATFRGQTR